MSSPTLSRHRVRTRAAVPRAAVLTDAERVAALEAEVGQLRAAMASRAAIEQAKGILMLLTSCSDPVAFELLVHISGTTHRKVRDVAEVLTVSASGAAALPDDVRTVLRDVCPPPNPPASPRH